MNCCKLFIRTRNSYDNRLEGIINAIFQFWILSRTTAVSNFDLEEPDNKDVKLNFYFKERKTYSNIIESVTNTYWDSS